MQRQNMTRTIGQQKGTGGGAQCRRSLSLQEMSQFQAKLEHGVPSHMARCGQSLHHVSTFFLLWCWNSTCLIELQILTCHSRQDCEQENQPTA